MAGTPVSDVNPAAPRGVWKRLCDSLLSQVRLVVLLTKHPKLPWPARMVGIAALGYVFSPIQLIPNFIPIVGQMDDVLVLYLAIKLLRKLAPPSVLEDCVLASQTRANTATVPPPNVGLPAGSLDNCR